MSRGKTNGPDLDVTEAIFAFDGRSAADLKLAAQKVSPADAEALLDLCSSEDSAHRVAATWIVKALLETSRGAMLDLSAVFARLGEETAPDAILHLLQSVQYAPTQTSTQLSAIEAHLDHKKTLVAVWALDAVVRIALYTGQRMVAARDLVDAALTHDKASMRARARHLAPLLGL
ncbi:MAG: hypothetical protein AAGA06_05800 [Pseudomonadota bacterium]